MKWTKLFVAVVIVLSGCGMGSKMAMKEKSLYERLGSKEAITAVVDEFVANIAADSRINTFFKDANIPHLKKMLVEQICEATGGPIKYTGLDMKTAHKGMGVSSADFNALVEDLVKALDKFKVPEKEKGELISALGGMKNDIVEKQTKSCRRGYISSPAV